MSAKNVPRPDFLLHGLVRCELRRGWESNGRFISDLDVAIQTPIRFGGEIQIESYENVSTPWAYTPVPDVVTVEPSRIETQEEIATRLLASNDLRSGAAK